MYVVQDTALLLANKVLVNEQLCNFESSSGQQPPIHSPKKNRWTCGIVILFLVYNMEP